MTPNNIDTDDLIHTSLSIKDSHLNNIKMQAEILDISVNDLIVLLLRRAIRDKGINKIQSQNYLIKYQKRTKNYSIVNIYLSQRDYESVITARRFFKLSVSWILAYALENFLFEVINKVKLSLTNTRQILNNYLNNHSYLVKIYGKKYLFQAKISPFT